MRTLTLPQKHVVKLTKEQIAIALKQAGPGAGVEEAWRKKYGGIGPSELRRLRELEEENRKLKQIAADLSLDKTTHAAAA